jgi:hypothetical protein
MEKFMLFLSIFIILNPVNLKELRFVFETFRHGARAPFEGINDINEDIFGQKWEFGSEEITEVGMREHYLAGYRSRERYSGFLSQKYDLSEVYAITSDVNRTIMSAYSHLNGLFPPSKGKELSDFQISQAIPPVYIPNLDSLLKELGRFPLSKSAQAIPLHIFEKNSNYFYIDCPALSPYYEHNRNAQIIKDLFQNFNFTYGELISKNFNITFKDFNDIEHFSDLITCSYYDNRVETFEKLEKIGINTTQLRMDCLNILENNIYTKLYGKEPGDHVPAKVTKSAIMLSVVEWIENRIRNDQQNISFIPYSSPKMVLYSMHDDDLSAINLIIEEAFQKEFKPYVSFASSLYIELYRNEKRSWTSKFLSFLEEPLALSLDEENLYTIEINFNGEVYYQGSYNEFKQKLTKTIYSIEYIDEFCGF